MYVIEFESAWGKEMPCPLQIRLILYNMAVKHSIRAITFNGVSTFTFANDLSNFIVGKSIKKCTSH